MPRASETAGTGTDHLWAKAAELERDFAGYKRRLAERRAQAQHAVAEAAGRRAGGGGEEDDRAGDAAGRGRRYEEYVRRRDERLRQEWRARMERKEAEVQALWARLDRSRRGGGGDDDHDGGELAAAATRHAREDQVKLPEKPGNLVVKVKPSTPVTPRGNPGHPPSTKLARPRTSVPSSLAAGSPGLRLSTPDPRRRPSHLHRVQPQPQAQAQPPATPRKENNRPPPPSVALAAAASQAATPRPRTTTMMSRSRSMFKDRGCSSVPVGGESPRPPRFQFQPPRSSYDGASASSNLKELTPSPRANDAIALVRSSSCSREQTVVADRRKASAVAPEPFLVKRSGNDIEPTPAPPVVPKDLPYSGEITPAGGAKADNKSNQQEYVDQSSDKFGSEEITGDSDTEPSYVYIKKDSDEQIPRPPQASAGVGTCPGPQPRSDTDNKEDSDNVEDTMESTGSNEVAGETPAAGADDEELRRESSESLYSNVQSSFSTRSELDTSVTGSPFPSATEQSPESNTSPWTGKKSTEVEVAEKRPPTPTTPRSSVQSPMDAVNGLKRLLTFGKRNGKASEAAAPAAVERALRSVTPAPPATAGDDGSVSGECPAGGSAKLTVDSSEYLDNSYVISPHVGSLQSIGSSYPASSELKEPVLHAKSPRVHRSFFSFSSFKSRAN
ncbi:hypothetical protein BDA96_10G088200 [Sorghum bicolor]|uniref:Uncharacterized protein n=2 Tax=Sorghum bicolor TaxID=4558 RepID=A0A921U060_SORBI|nr:mediator of DNA damage checkpoint protein 1 [Sorghum bicolor]KAG0513283.1 hypothetical protein BDA96_10G088200 [Sorghum bicolor]|eukprot:XP_021304772.1 mediator of DNA damage checkpoint protein 1 [Sorghum bicolor]